MSTQSNRLSANWAIIETVAGKRTGAAAKLGERGALKVCLPGVANNYHIFFLALDSACPQVRDSSLPPTVDFVFALFCMGFSMKDLFFSFFFSGTMIRS